MDPLPATTTAAWVPLGLGVVGMGWWCESCWDWRWWSGIEIWVLLGLGMVGKDWGSVLYISEEGNAGPELPCPMQA